MANMTPDSPEHQRAVDPRPDHAPGLRPPQFTLTGLLIGVTLLAICLVTFRTMGPVATCVIVLAALAVLGHVAGNALGTQLRSSTDAARRKSGSSRAEKAEPHHFAQTTKLAERVQLRWPMWALTGFCAVCGALAGGRFLAEVNAAQATTANLTLAYASCGVLGAILGFGLSMFLKVMLEAWWQAHRAD
jgi:hypothetical protein